MLVVSLLYISANGTEYVNWPKLNPPDEVLQYEGNGFRSARNGRGGDVLGLPGKNVVKRLEEQAKKLQ